MCKHKAQATAGEARGLASLSPEATGMYAHAYMEHLTCVWPTNQPSQTSHQCYYCMVPFSRCHSIPSVQLGKWMKRTWQSGHSNSAPGIFKNAKFSTVRKLCQAGGWHTLKHLQNIGASESSMYYLPTEKKKGNSPQRKKKHNTKTTIIFSFAASVSEQCVTSHEPANSLRASACEEAEP